MIKIKLINFLSNMTNPYSRYVCGPDDFIARCRICGELEYETLLYSIGNKPVCHKCLDSEIMSKRISNTILEKKGIHTFDCGPEEIAENCALCGKVNYETLLYDVSGYPICSSCYNILAERLIDESQKTKTLSKKLY